ncbi:MAG: disulfide bond formation protein [Rickettsiales bacterium]|jgi:disulfide bond formation protein DsbB|nr:disulfide bond formation protein [Rickettsiales bacterium]
MTEMSRRAHTAKPRVFFILFVGSLLALIVAFISEYRFGLEPCTLCVYQRIPYAVVVGLSLLGLLRILNPRLAPALLVLCLLALAANAGLAFYHMGVEYHWFAGLETCSGDTMPVDDPQALLESLMAADAVRCDIPAFVFLGLSMAAWNMIYAAILLLTALRAWRPKRSKGVIYRA